MLRFHLRPGLPDQSAAFRYRTKCLRSRSSLYRPARIVPTHRLPSASSYMVLTPGQVSSSMLEQQRVMLEFVGTGIQSRQAAMPFVICQPDHSGMVLNNLRPLRIRRWKLYPPHDFPGQAIESVQTRRRCHPKSSILRLQGRADDVAAQSGGIVGIVLVVDRFAGAASIPYRPASVESQISPARS